MLNLRLTHILIPILIVISQTLVAQGDVEAIKRVIEQESTAYFNVDYKAWSETWVQAPHA